MPHLPAALALLLLLLTAAPGAHAHRLSDACLRVQVDHGRLTGRLDFPIRDLAEVIALDANGDRSVTWGELRTHASDIAEWVTGGLEIRSPRGSRVDLEVIDLQVATVAGEPCASLALRQTGALPPGPFELHYRLLADIDPHHRGLVRWEQDGQVESSVLGPDRPVASFGLTPGGSPQPKDRARWRGFVAEGVHHIWTGYDHLLFLFALLLPAVLPRVRRTTSTRGDLGDTLVQVLKVVTAFTVAHSITLVLAGLQLVRLPSAPVEIAIAASVAVAALDNLVPLFRRHGVGLRMAFAFGLIHGFGFAGVLEELDLPATRFVQGVLGFNLGVELGQLAIVAVFLPIAFAARKSWAYRQVALPWGSAAILAIALFWLGQRTLSAGLFPG